MSKNIESKNTALSYVRAFVTLLVLAHHTALAYITFVPFPAPSFTAQPYYWAAFPVLDHARWVGFDFLVGWNDIFFMSLMFFLSGVFVWPSLTRKGAGAFLKQRGLRLGLPFVVAAVVLSPLAYYPTYHLTGADPNFLAYAKAWLSLTGWPSGPAWFIWLLLAFDCVAAACFALVPRGMERLGAFCRNAGERPIVFYVVLVATSAAAYLPLAHVFGSLRWSGFGPFAFQTSRVLLYCLYFFAGISVGAFGSESGLLATTGKLARRWLLWGIFAVLAYAVEIMTLISGRALLTDVMFVLSCAASSFFSLAVFLRFSGKNRIWGSLSRNAYGMYLAHYVFVVWLQYTILTQPLPALAKALTVFSGVVALSWATTAALRRSAVVAKVI